MTEQPKTVEDGSGKALIEDALRKLKKP